MESGYRGKRGPRGQSGARGAQGAVGRRGLTGARGPTGPAGPTVTKVQMLAAVSNEFAAVNQRLQTQVTRIAQLQQQLDLQQSDIADTRADVIRIRRVIENLIKV